VWPKLRIPVLVTAVLGLTAAVLPSSGASALTAPAGGASSGAGADRPRVGYTRWTSAADFEDGTFDGTRTTGGGALTIARPVGKRTYKDPFGAGEKEWDYARWLSPVRKLGFGATELVASWTADAGPGTWVEIEMRGTTDKGAKTKWYVMGRWSADDPGAGGDVNRTSVPDQGDDNGNVSIDTFVTKSGRSLRDYQLRVTLYRLPGTERKPTLRSVGAMASALPNRETVPVSPGGEAWGVELDVPRKSQNIHEGHFPEWDGGGEAWCSPTSSAMVLDYWNRGPSDEDMDWVPDTDSNPEVDYAARNTYDHNYEGAGNWPFNTAYAGRFGLDGFVTRLRTVTELEKFIKAGIPVITSQSFKAEELPGSGYSTNGHLFVIVGFTETGDPIVNDPASSSNDAVRNVYPRANFENVWLRSSSSGGIAYVITPPGRRLPPNVPGLDKNW
jgi:Peptidase_C39 like family